MRENQTDTQKKYENEVKKESRDKFQCKSLRFSGRVKKLGTNCLCFNGSLQRIGILALFLGLYFVSPIASAGIQQCPDLAGLYFCKDEGSLPYILAVTQTSNETRVSYRFVYDTPMGTLERSVPANEEGIEAKAKTWAQCSNKALYEGESLEKLDRISGRLENGDLIRKNEKQAIIAECRKWEPKR